MPAAILRVTVTAANAGGSGDRELQPDGDNGPGNDTTPPTVSVTAPRSGSSVSGSTTLTASAADNVGVAKVEFYVDGKLLATDTASPYTTTWNPATVALGTHSLTAKAYDQAGNSHHVGGRLDQGDRHDGADRLDHEPGERELRDAQLDA